MSNPTTIDRRDVAHPTNPIGGHDHVEENDLGQPLDPKAAKMPAAGDSAALHGIPADVLGPQRDAGGPLDISVDDATQPMAERELKGEGPADDARDDRAKRDAIAEIAREKGDTYMVATDLEDADQRGPAPGMKEQP